MSTLYSFFDEAFLDALNQPDVTMALAVKVEFASGVSRVHSGTGTLTIAGETYYGVGALGEISAAKEEHTTSPTQVTMALNALDTSLLATTLNERCINRPVTIMAVVYNELGQSVGANVLFKGKIARTAVTAGDTNSIGYTVSNIFEDWKYGDPWRFTQESHSAQYPGDDIFQYVAQMSERPIYWGSEKDAQPFARYK